MGIARMALYLVGGALVIVGLAMLFFETGLANWVPGTIALAGLVILVGLLVMGMSERTREPRPVEDRGVVVEERRRY